MRRYRAVATRLLEEDKQKLRDHYAKKELVLQKCLSGGGSDRPRSNLFGLHVRPHAPESFISK